MDINEAHHEIKKIVGFKGYPPALLIDNTQPPSKAYVACLYPDLSDKGFVIQGHSWVDVVDRVKEKIMNNEKAVRDEKKFCVDCRHYNPEEQTCLDRLDAISLVTGISIILWTDKERRGDKYDAPKNMVGQYSQCGFEGKHWKAKHLLDQAQGRQG